MLLKPTHKSEAVPAVDKVATVFLAVFTSSYARLHLYDIMGPFNTCVLYYDTDSIVYVPDPRLLNPPLADYLGDVTGEYVWNHIEECVSAGPKNYAYRNQSGKPICKVRGYRLNYDTPQKIKVQSMVLNSHQWLQRTVSRSGAYFASSPKIHDLAFFSFVLSVRGHIALRNIHVTKLYTYRTSGQACMQLNAGKTATNRILDIVR